MKSIFLLLIAPMLMLLALGCGQGNRIVNTPTPETKLVIKVEVEPSPTKESPKALPTKPSTTAEMGPSLTLTPWPILTSTPLPTTATPTFVPTATPTALPTLTPIAGIDQTPTSTAGLGELFLVVDSPSTLESLAREESILIIGRTRVDAVVTVNDHMPVPDIVGRFRQELVLDQGATIIEIIASLPTGEEESVVLAVIYFP